MTDLKSPSWELTPAFVIADRPQASTQQPCPELDVNVLGPHRRMREACPVLPENEPERLRFAGLVRGQGVITVDGLAFTPDMDTSVQLHRFFQGNCEIVFGDHRLAGVVFSAGGERLGGKLGRGEILIFTLDYASVGAVNLHTTTKRGKTTVTAVSLGPTGMPVFGIGFEVQATRQLDGVAAKTDARALGDPLIELCCASRLATPGLSDADYDQIEAARAGKREHEPGRIKAILTRPVT